MTASATSFADFHRRSIESPDAFWAERASLIDWHEQPGTICDDTRAPFTRWFGGGTTNLCHNAVDRHLKDRAAQPALVAVSTETDTERSYAYAELHRETVRAAAMLRGLGVGRGDRVLIYMPMVAEAVFAMLACARLGAIHCVVFGGFASAALASRIEDATPKVVVAADAGSRGGKVVAYKPLLDEAIRLSAHKPDAVLLTDRGLAPMTLEPGRDRLWNDLAARHEGEDVACEWMEATEPSYTIYTSGTTGRPKGVQRDTGGYAVALAASMRDIFEGGAGDTFFCTSDIGWVVGHSYIVYGPLIAGMTTILYEGLPTRPDAAIWWRIVERHRVNVMFSAPTAVRVLKKQDPECLTRHDRSSLRSLFLAGEPLDQPTARWVSGALPGVNIVDNYWQTESGWPILTIANGVERRAGTFGSPGVPMAGYRVRIVHEATGEELTGADQKGVVVIESPTPPGFMQTIWRDDDRFLDTYWRPTPGGTGREPGDGGRWLYSTFDWGIRDASGDYFILGRTDDVINVAGHRLGTREIEEAIAGHPGVAEVAVVGVADALKGQVALAFVVPRDAAAAATPEAARALEGEIMKRVDALLGAVARPQRVHLVGALPKTRSGKLLRRAIQAVMEGRETGDLSTMEDPAALDQVRKAAAD